MSNKWFKKIAKFFAIIIAIILIPQALNIQSELNMRTIISAVAVDLQEDGYLVTVQVVKPASTAEGGGTKLDFISASAKTLADAMDEASIALGRTAGLNHIGTIILGKEVAEKGKIISALDYFLREKGIQNSAMLLIAEKKAKDTLESTQKLQLSSAVGLPKVFLYKQNNTNGVMMQLQNFLNDNMTISKCSVISGVEILSKEEAEKQEGNESGGESSGSGSSGGESGGSSGGESSGSSGGSSGGGSSSSDDKNGRIKYANNIYVFKEGVLKHTIEDNDAINGVYLINRNSKEGLLTVENVSNKYIDNKSVSVYFRDKKVKIKTEWQKGLPKCTFTIITNRNEVYAIEDEKINDQIYETDKVYLTEEVVKKVEEKVKEDILKAFNECKEVGVDIFQCANRLYQRSPKQWKEFFNKFGEDYIKHIEIDVKLKFKMQN